MKKVSNIIYFCSSPDSPSGGVKVIIRHSQIINDLDGRAIKSSVVFPNNLQYSADWFEHQAEIKRDMNFNPLEDFIVIPEIWAMRFGQILLNEGFRYAIFVQGGYLIFNSASLNDIEKLKSVYDGAEVIMSISDDTTTCISRAFGISERKIFKSQYSLNQDVFYTPNSARENIITYMPRRLPAHSSYLLSLLTVNISNGWNIVPIDKMQEHEVGEVLRVSKIFLSFSELEGLPLPPLEAAICGNVVIGYTGQGGDEYWAQPNFEKVNSGDLKNYYEKVLEIIEYINEKPLGIMSDKKALDNIASITKKYDAKSEKKRLAEWLDLLT